MKRILLCTLFLFTWACSSESSEAISDADAGATDMGDVVAPIDSYELAAPVEVRIDENAMPHIYAANDLDLMYAAGYMQARDRLFSVDISRRAATGRLAEVFGEERESGDIQAHVLGFERWAQRSVAHMADVAPDDHNLLVAFAEGFNRHVAEIQSGDVEAPEGYAEWDFEPERFSPTDLMAIGTRIQFGFGSTLEFDLLNTVLRALVSESKAEAIAIHRPVSETWIVEDRSEGSGLRRSALEPSDTVELEQTSLQAMLDGWKRFRKDLGVGDGSNAFAIAPEASFNGRSMLANDSHASYFDPNAMWMAHLNSADQGGSFDVAGFAFGGVPGIHVGHNRRIAWGATTAFADCTDLWDVTVEEEQLIWGDQRLPLNRLERTYSVKTDQGLEERELDVLEVTGLGVILPPELLPVPRQILARGELFLAWSGFRPLTDLSMFFAFDRAQTLDEFDRAVKTQTAGMQNWHFASASGTRHRANSLVPDRGNAESRPRSSTIMDGSDPSTTWAGTLNEDGFQGDWLSPDELPFVADDRRYIASANNDPFGFTKDGDPHNDSIYFGAFFSPHFRAGRIQETLDDITTGTVDVDAMRALQTDVRSAMAERVVPLLQAAVEAIDNEDSLLDFREDARIPARVQELVAWDQRMVRTSKEATLFRMFTAYLAREILADDLPLLFDAIESEQPVFISKMTLTALESRSELLINGTPELALLKAFVEAIDTFEARGEPPWGEVLEARFVKPDRTYTSRSIDGADTVPAVAQCAFFNGEDELGETCVATAGAVYRWVVTFDDDGHPAMTFSTPMNETGSTEDWIENQFVKMPFLREDVERATQSEMTLR